MDVVCYALGSAMQRLLGGLDFFTVRLVTLFFPLTRLQGDGTKSAAESLCPHPIDNR